MLGVKKNTQKIITSLFLSALVFQGVFVNAGVVHAHATVSDPVEAATVGGATTAGVKNGQGIATGNVSTGFGMSSITGSLKDFSLWILGLIRSAIILIIASPAAALFVWVVDPANVSGPNGVLNFPAVYTLWQFIRDFFNLFFIFILLFSAFATIFQVDSFNIRNIFKNILLTALLINFSFPITRFLIDVANVPMYYFINDVIGAGGGQGAVIAMNNLLGFSGTAAAALTTDYIPTFAAIIFVFLFGVSLAVLSVMLIVRLIALTLLLVFSPIGFAGSLLPGFNKYGQEWWSKFWSYAFFGPAAALMLVVSLKFLEATQTANIWRSVDQVSTNVSIDASGSTLITNVIFFTIPIILIWATIGLANKFSVAGAATVVGLGYGAAHWTRKKVQSGVVRSAKFAGRTAAAPLKPMAKGVSAGFKESVQSGKWFGKQAPKILTGKFYKESAENREAKWKGRMTGGSKGAATETEKLQSKRQYEAADEMKKNNVSNSDLQIALAGGDKIKAAAAAMVLTDRKAIQTTDDFSRALKALGNNTKEVSSLIEKAGSGAVEIDAAAYGAAVGSDTFKHSDGTSNIELQKQFEARLLRDGQAKTIVEHKIATVPGITRDAAVSGVLGDIKSVKEQAKQESLFKDPAFNAEIQRYVTGLALQRRTELEKAAAQESPDVAVVLAGIP